MAMAFFNFQWAASKPNEIWAIFVYLSWVSMVTLAHDWISKGIYFLLRFTMTIIFYGCMIFLLAMQDDYWDRRYSILSNDYISQVQRSKLLEELQQSMIIDNPFQWPMEGTNRQVWVIVCADVFIWCVYVYWIKHVRDNNTIGFRAMRISSSDSEISV